MALNQSNIIFSAMGTLRLNELRAEDAMPALRPFFSMLILLIDDLS